MKLQRIFRTGLVGAFAFGSGAAFACSSAFSSAVSNYQLAFQGNPECFVAGNPGATAVISATSLDQMQAISNVAGSRLLGAGPSGGQLAAAPMTGMAAGGALKTINLWGNVSQNTARYGGRTLAAVPATIESNNNVWNWVAGADYRVSSNLIVGVSGALDRGRGSVQVNPSYLITEGYSLAAYAGYQINRNWALDGSVGFGEGTTTVQGGAVTDADKRFYSANLSFTDWSGNWQYSGKLNYLNATDKLENLRINGTVVNGSSADVKLERVRLGAEVGYWLANGLMPYVSLAYAADLTHTKAATIPMDRDALLVSVGVNFFSLKNGVTGGVSYTEETSRANSSNATFMANVGIRFLNMMLTQFQKAAPLCAAFLFTLLSACVTTPDQRAEVMTVGAQHGFADVSEGTGAKRLFALLRGKAGSDGVLNVYIEGDGAAWPSPYRPPSDPTPAKPIVMSLALSDPNAAVAYLGRPCQYLESKDLSACPTEYWTGLRFAPEVIESMNLAVDRLKRQSGARSVRLIGYSGGGVVAALLAARRTDVRAFATIAAPLSLETWTLLHGITPLNGSLDPGRSANRRLPPAVHFVGGRDRIVPETVVADFATQTGGKIAFVQDFDHECCWPTAWPVLLKDIP